MQSTKGADLLVIRSRFRYVIETFIPFLSAGFCTWAVGWFDHSGLSIWTAIVAVTAGGMLVCFDVNLLKQAHSYRFVVAYTIAIRSIMAGFICVVAMLLDGIRSAYLQTAFSFTALIFITTTVGSIMAISVALRPKFRRVFKKLAIVAVTETGISFVEQLKSQPYLALEFVGYVEDRVPARLPAYAPHPILCRMDEMNDYLKEHEINHVLISLPLHIGLRFEQVLKNLLNTTCSVHYLHDFLIFKPIREGITSMGNMSVFTIIDAPSSGWGSIFKRAFDIAVSAVALVLLSPLLIATAVWIKLDSRGPILFAQNRWGDGAAPFKIYKFRSMSQAASTSLDLAQATKGDMRVTKVGAFIRRTSIDELPQLFNILRGDMSLVGPRPHAIAHNQEYRHLVKGYMLRHKIKPGLTGWAQIHGFRGETDTLDKMENRVEYDLEYLRTWTPALDLYIIYRTIGLVLKRTNAY